jgi:hypothetical protein
VLWFDDRDETTEGERLFAAFNEHDPVSPAFERARQAIVDDHLRANELVTKLAAQGIAAEVEGPLQPGPSTTLDSNHSTWYSRSAADGGLDFDFVKGYAGARASGIHVIDVEMGWDLASSRLPTPGELTPVSPADGTHGAAVLGALGANRGDDGFEGLVSEASFRIAQVDSADPEKNVFNVVRAVAQQARQPAVVLIEREMTKLEGENLLCCLPLERWSIGRRVLRFATGRGIHVVQAAGNGSHELAALDVRTDSIVVAARDPDGTRSVSSNRGERIDLWGPGRFVTTLNGGGLLGGFGGTSSAAAVVAAAVAALCGILSHNGFVDLPPDQMRRMLINTGSSSAAGTAPMPDLRKAVRALEAGRGTFERR